MSETDTTVEAHRPARVAIVGYAHEANALAAPLDRTNVTEIGELPGGALAFWEVLPFVERLRDLRDVELVPGPVYVAPAGGPMRHGDFTVMADAIDRALAEAEPLDACAFFGHGAGVTTEDHDPDGTLLTRARRRLGPHVPLVVVLDFHANVTAAMCAASDVLVGYRTNPHVDIGDRAVEAAEHVHELLDGRRTVRAWCPLPLALPQIALLTDPAEPLGIVVAEAEGALVAPIRNVSVFGGFALSDVAGAGTSIVVTADCDGDPEGDLAAELAERLAARTWSLRHDFRVRTTAIADAVAAALAAARGERAPLVLADVADNPGGGAPGTTTFVLAALDAALNRGGLTAAGGSVDERAVVLGLQCDPAVVRQAQLAGVGATIEVTFNAGSTDPLATPFTATATVLHLASGTFVPSHGIYTGARRNPGDVCALRIGALRVGVCSRAIQTAEPEAFEHVGLDPTSAAVIVVKSRGHFRAGFAHLPACADVIEVGAPGVATAAIDTVAWAHLTRPSFPLDPDTTFQPRADRFTTSTSAKEQR
jgi:microcystin degradation protein MlrC